MSDTATVSSTQGRSSFSIRKVFGSLLLLFGLMVIYFTYHFVTPYWSKSPADRLKAIWTNDLEVLAASQKLPQAWTQLRQVDIVGLSPEVQEWLKNGQAKFATRADGKYRLEVMVDDWTDKGDKGVMIQYNIVDLATGNTTWELGRTLTVLPKDLN